MVISRLQSDILINVTIFHKVWHNMNTCHCVTVTRMVIQIPLEYVVYIEISYNDYAAHLELFNDTLLVYYMCNVYHNNFMRSI